MVLETLITTLRAAPAVAHKADIRPVMAGLAGLDSGHLPLGDDAAALADGDGFLLMAMEGFVNEFVAAEPFFAGYCGVMVNVSDIAAMGGHALAITDALWSRGDQQSAAILAGLREAAGKYGVPLVGGHSNAHCDRPQLSVAILGRARALLTSFDARPGDTLLVACDLRGRYRAVGDNWDASSDAPGARLRGDLAILPGLAEDGLCRAGKDISMAGPVGTALMLLEASGVGAELSLDALPRPAEVPLSRWLRTFPSYGFVLAVAPDRVAEVSRRFQARDLAVAEVGRVTDGDQLTLSLGTQRHPFWNHQQTPYLGRPFAPRSPLSRQGGHHA